MRLKNIFVVLLTVRTLDVLFFLKVHLYFDRIFIIRWLFYLTDIVGELTDKSISLTDIILKVTDKPSELTDICNLL